MYMSFEEFRPFYYRACETSHWQSTMLVVPKCWPSWNQTATSLLCIRSSGIIISLAVRSHHRLCSTVFPAATRPKVVSSEQGRASDPE